MPFATDARISSGHAWITVGSSPDAVPQRSRQPSPGTALLAGGFTLCLNGRSTTIGNGSVAWSLDGSGVLRHTISATVDGQAVRILAGSGPDATEECRAYLGSVLGTNVRDRQGGLVSRFTSTGPPG